MKPIDLAVQLDRGASGPGAAPGARALLKRSGARREQRFQVAP